MGKTLDTDSNSKLNASELKLRASQLLIGQVVQKVEILNEREIVIFFNGGGRLFVDAKSDLNISIT